MPKISKAEKLVSSRPGEAPTPKPEIKLFRCCRCGQIYKNQRTNFPRTTSMLWRGNDGYLPVCTNCVEELFSHYKTVLGSEGDALRRMCLKLDLYWSPRIYSMACKTGVANSIIRSYISKLNLVAYAGKTFDDTLDEEVMEQVQNDFQNEQEKIWEEKEAALQKEKEALQKKLEEALAETLTTRTSTEGDASLPIQFDSIPVPTPEIVDFWGPGYTPEIYHELDRRYRKWTAGKEEEIDETSSALYKQICLCEVNIANNMIAGKPIETAQRSLNDLLGSLNAKPVQKKQDEEKNSAFDSLPFGVGIKMCENSRPIPKPDPRFDDVDGIVRYISVWFLGHLCKMLGIRNTYCKLYEQEIERLRVERPELEEEDDETVFNDIFADDVHEEES